MSNDNYFICPHCGSDEVETEQEEGFCLTIYYCKCVCSFSWSEFIVEKDCS